MEFVLIEILLNLCALCQSVSVIVLVSVLSLWRDKDHDKSVLFSF